MNANLKQRGDNSSQTTVGRISGEVLAYTAGRDAQLDRELVAADCLGSAAHAVMLSRVPVSPPLFTDGELRKLLDALGGILREAAQGKFVIRIEDQDVHLAVERELTRRTGPLGRRIHTARSRNDQVALDLRLYSRERLLSLARSSAQFMLSMLAFARRNREVPMMGRTHSQPAMPSSVGLWASAYVEDMEENMASLRHVYDLNNRCPLGAAAGYGVPLPIDRALTARLLGFDAPIHNVLHAINARGKNEFRILNMLGQIMLTLSRLAQDMITFSMPEFGYFSLPPELGTGSSIMPQKNNPDVLELVRARAARLLGNVAGTGELLRGLPSGYQRDLQETKEPLITGLETAESSVRIMNTMVRHLSADKKRLRNSFTPSVFAADQALVLVRRGIPFRDAYRRVKENPRNILSGDLQKEIAARNHLGAPGGLDLDRYQKQILDLRRWAAKTERRLKRLALRLLSS